MQKKDKPGPVIQTLDPLRKKNLLIVNTGGSGFHQKKFVFKAIKKLGLNKVIVLNREKDPWAKYYVDEWILADTNNHEESLKAVKAYMRESTIDGVFTFWEDDVLLTSKIVDAHGFIGIPYSIAKNARNKYSFREFCKLQNLPYPRHRLIQSFKDLEIIDNQLTYPLVIKPLFGCSSAFVVKIENKQELINVYQFMQEHISPSVESSLHDGIGIMAEEYIDGEEVDMDIVLQNGKLKFYSITDNAQTAEPFFVEVGENIPSRLPDKAQNDLISMAEVTLEKLGVQQGIIHFEAKHTKHGPVPIEVNLRMGGDNVYSFVKSAWGIDLIEEGIKIALGIYIQPLKPTSPKSYLSFGYFLPSSSGIITNFDIDRSGFKEFQVKEFHLFKEVGDIALTPPTGFEFLGWISTSGDNSIDARENLEKAMKKISYKIVPFSGASAIGKTQRKSPFSSAFLQPKIPQQKAKMNKLKYMDLRKQRELTIGVASNYYHTINSSVESDISKVGITIEHTLQERGYKIVRIDWNTIPSAVNILQKQQVDLVFNVAEYLNNSPFQCPHITALYDAYQIPFTGSDMFNLAVCQDKIRVKKLLTYHNIPTAKWDYLYDIDDSIREDFTYPLIVKVANADNSIGLTNNSVVINKKELTRQIEYIMKELKRPVLIEEYLEGDEYDVSILGNYNDNQQVLPLSRSIFKLPDGYWNIYPFEAKFQKSDIYKRGITIERPPKKVNKKLLSLISEIALDTYNILDCHDYGRVEVKLDKEGNPHVLELNPNASIDKGDCIPTVAKLAGLDYGDFIERIIAHAIGRYKKV